MASREIKDYIRHKILLEQEEGADIDADGLVEILAELWERK